MADLFVYGALMYDEVWNRIVVGKFSKNVAKVEGHRRLKVKNEEYPGVVKGVGEVAGYIWHDVDEENLIRLDTFEGKYYQRVEDYAIDDDGKNVKVYLYLFKNEFHTLLEDESWDVEEFEKTGLSKFGAEYVGFDRFKGA